MCACAEVSNDRYGIVMAFVLFSFRLVLAILFFFSFEFLTLL